ncbi:hypothetical protein ABT063_46390 [Streptomyces sp. NPDC002838]|uniref:hypothetical protein n=1 Tax=Streptomyces sp. NPDC002838 TaxID=3154436 RepID=UPI003322D6B8
MHIIESEVTTASSGAGGKHREGGGLAGTGSRLQDEVVSCSEGVGGLDLLVGVGKGSSGRGGGGLAALQAVVDA